MKRAIELKVNGDTHELLVAPNYTLLEVLREKLGLMGTKRGCDLGACGACTVLIDGEAYLSCLMLAVDAAGKEIVTIEGLAAGGDLHPLQKAFKRRGSSDRGCGQEKNGRQPVPLHRIQENFGSRDECGRAKCIRLKPGWCRNKNCLDTFLFFHSVF